MIIFFLGLHTKIGITPRGTKRVFWLCRNCCHWHCYYPITQHDLLNDSVLRYPSNGLRWIQNLRKKLIPFHMFCFIIFILILVYTLLLLYWNNKQSWNTIIIWTHIFIYSFISRYKHDWARRKSEILEWYVSVGSQASSYPLPLVAGWQVSRLLAAFRISLSI